MPTATPSGLPPPQRSMTTGTPVPVVAFQSDQSRCPSAVSESGRDEAIRDESHDGSQPEIDRRHGRTKRKAA
jgi:hypothetical protein